MMNKANRVPRVVFLSITLVLLCPAIAFANSSWVWVSETRPYDLLPYVIVGTLVIEISAINYIPKTGELKRTAIVVILANLLSFAAPYIACLFSQVYDFNQMLNNTPMYTVGIVFFLMTVIVELPIVYNLLRGKTKNEKTLFLTIVIANVMTTAGVAIAERIFCEGWYA